MGWFHHFTHHAFHTITHPPIVSHIPQIIGGVTPNSLRNRVNQVGRLPWQARGIVNHLPIGEAVNAVGGLSGISSQLGGVASELGGFGSQIGGLGSQIGGLGSQIGGLGSQLTGEIGGLGSQIGGLGSQIGGLGSQMTGEIGGLGGLMNAQFANMQNQMSGAMNMTFSGFNSLEHNVENQVDSLGSKLEGEIGKYADEAKQLAGEAVKTVTGTINSIMKWLPIVAVGVGAVILLK